MHNPGEWDYFGDTPWDSKKWGTYSVGIFQWIPKSKKGVKKSTVQFRLIGDSGDRSAVDAAESICKALNEGRTTIEQITEGKKSMRLGHCAEFPPDLLDPL